jgi:choline kinase
MHLIILASGRGSRLKKINQNPKCLNQINKKKIIEIILKNHYFFSKIIVCIGYKGYLIKKFLKNLKYKKTNMVESLFLCKKYFNENIIVSYADIIYDKSILKNMVKKKYSHLPLNENWKKIWKLRMNNNKILKDAENVITRNKKIIKIGLKIKKQMPKYQFMGLARFQMVDIKNLLKFYDNINNKKIDFTNFLNLAIQNKEINLKYFTTKKFWFEFDTPQDIIAINKALKNNDNLVSRHIRGW